MEGARDQSHPSFISCHLKQTRLTAVRVSDHTAVLRVQRRVWNNCDSVRNFKGIFCQSAAACNIIKRGLWCLSSCRPKQHQHESVNQLLSSKSFSGWIKGRNLWMLHTDPADRSLQQVGTDLVSLQSRPPEAEVLLSFGLVFLIKGHCWLVLTRGSQAVLTALCVICYTLNKKYDTV